MTVTKTLSASAPLALPGQRIGLFGGSFNPPHAGHYAISLEALKRLQVDFVWWLVAPQNPLKDPAQNTALDGRPEQARALVRHPRIKVTGFESVISSRYTADTVKAVRLHWPATRFVWIMGADSFAQLHLWQDWTELVGQISIAVIDRPGFTLAALSSPAAQRFARFRIDMNDAGQLVDSAAPAWCFLQIPRRPESSTSIRSAHNF